MNVITLVGRLTRDPSYSAVPSQEVLYIPKSYEQHFHPVLPELVVTEYIFLFPSSQPPIINLPTPSLASVTSARINAPAANTPASMNSATPKRI